MTVPALRSTVTADPVSGLVTRAEPEPAAIAGSPLMVKLAVRPGMTDLERTPRGPERKTAAFQRLVATAAESQKPFVDIAQQLKQSGAVTGYESLVTPNMLIVTPASSTKEREVLSAFAINGVKAIYRRDGARAWAAGQPVTDGAQPAPIAPSQTWGLDVVDAHPRTTVEPNATGWNLELIGAPEAWKTGATGRGVTVGSIDTGTDVTHPAIHDAYRGANPDGTLSNDYNWFDMSSSRSPQPTDQEGHGTHTVGTMVGRTADASIGVAPEARWISVRGLTGGGGADVLLRSLQWMQAPTKVDGTAPDPTRAPDVVGMSWWTAPPSEDFFQESIQNLGSAGIEPVKSAGNKGPGPESISSPGQYPEITSAAAVDKNGDIASFSSRGPSPLPHTGQVPVWKPDIAAPGVDVVSSMPGGKYAAMSGTSMAQPHVSGAIAAILSKYPQLSRSQLRQVLERSSSDVGAKGKDLEFGAGIVNLPAALAEAARILGTGAPAGAP